MSRDINTWVIYYALFTSITGISEGVTKNSNVIGDHQIFVLTNSV